MKQMNKRESRIVALGLLIVLAIMVYSLLINPFVIAYSNATDDIDDLWYRIEKYQVTADKYNGIERTLERVKRMRPSQGNYVKGNSSALASASLQQYLTRVIANANGKIISTQNVREEASDIATAVVIKVHMRGGLRSLISTINHLESGKPMLFVEKLAVVTTPSRKLPGSNEVEEEQLDIQFNLVGYMISEDGA